MSKLENALNEADHTAVKTDICTSLNIDSFITLIVHFFDKNQIELKTVVLCIKKLICSHTANLLSKVISNELTDWNILNKIVAIVIDGDANIKLVV